MAAITDIDAKTMKQVGTLVVEVLENSLQYLKTLVAEKVIENEFYSNQEVRNLRLQCEILSKTAKKLELEAAIEGHKQAQEANTPAQPSTDLSVAVETNRKSLEGIAWRLKSVEGLVRKLAPQDMRTGTKPLQKTSQVFRQVRPTEEVVVVSMEAVKQP